MFNWTRSSSSRPEPISTRNCSRTVRKNRSILPLPAGWPGLGVHQPDPQRCAGTQQLLVHERRAVVDIDRRGDAAGRDASAQRGLQPHGVLATGPPVAGQQPGMVIEEREQDRLAAAHGRAVQRVAGPPHVRARRPRTGRTLAAAARRDGWSTPAARNGAAASARPVTSPNAPAGSPRPAPRSARGPPSSTPPPAPTHRPGCAGSTLRGSGPGHRTRRGASRGSTGRSWPAKPAPAARTGPHAQPRRARARAGPAASWSTDRSAASRINAVPEQGRPRGPVRPGPVVRHGWRAINSSFALVNTHQSRGSLIKPLRPRVSSC